MGEIVKSGDLGRIYYYDSVRVNLGLFQRDVNVITDLAVHDFSILDYVLGEHPVAVRRRPERGQRALEEAGRPRGHHPRVQEGHDATVVRAVLLPATMTLLGEWNWYLPAWLEWLPQGQTRVRAHGLPAHNVR